MSLSYPQQETNWRLGFSSIKDKVINLLGKKLHLVSLNKEINPIKAVVTLCVSISVGVQNGYHGFTTVTFRQSVTCHDAWKWVPDTSPNVIASVNVSVNGIADAHCEWARRHRKIGMNFTRLHMFWIEYPEIPNQLRKIKLPKERKTVRRRRSQCHLRKYDHIKL